MTRGLLVASKVTASIISSLSFSFFFLPSSHNSVGSTRGINDRDCVGDRRMMGT